MLNLMSRYTPGTRALNGSVRFWVASAAPLALPFTTTFSMPSSSTYTSTGEHPDRSGLPGLARFCQNW